MAGLAELKSAQALSIGQQGLGDEQAKLEQLVQFRKDYELMLEQKCSAGIEATQLQDYRQFLDKLSHAIEQQKSTLHESNENLALVREQWLSESRRKSALEHLAEVRHRQLKKGREKAEQLASDEHVLNRTFTLSDQ